jgi:hypothetical protein
VAEVNSSAAPFGRTPLERVVSAGPREKQQNGACRVHYLCANQPENNKMRKIIKKTPFDPTPRRRNAGPSALEDSRISRRQNNKNSRGKPRATDTPLSKPPIFFRFCKLKYAQDSREKPPNFTDRLFVVKISGVLGHLVYAHMRIHKNAFAHKIDCF